MTSARIERLTPELAADFPPVADDVFDAEPTKEHLEKLALMPGHALFVALGGDNVIGQLLCMAQFQADMPPQLYIHNLGVSPAFKRQGIAQALFRAAADWGRDCGCDSIWLATDIDSPEAQGFYRSLGFTRHQAEVFAGPIG
ncbi:MAG: GNAT family N-acetyltransferase [Pseudomonadota bacterium]